MTIVPGSSVVFWIGVGALGLVAVILITRAFWCWYFKIDKLMQLLQSIHPELQSSGRRETAFGTVLRAGTAESGASTEESKRCPRCHMETTRTRLGAKGAGVPCRCSDAARSASSIQRRLKVELPTVTDRQGGLSR